MTNEFKTYHPIINLIYFAFATGVTMLVMHPVFVAISLCCSLCYSAVCSGKSGMKTILCLLPFVLLASLINPLFNHEGATIITYFPNGNPLTMEAIFYGFISSLMIMSLISWFGCINKTMTSDKILYLFGRIIPSLSLIMSMTLRFIPQFKKQFTETANAQKCIGKSIASGTVVKRFKNIISVFSAMVSRSLENSIDSANSMKSRGYGLSGRSSFSIFRFDTRDVRLLITFVILGAYIIAGIVQKRADFSFYPIIGQADMSVHFVGIATAFALFCMTPLIIEAKEAIRWKFLKSKI